MAKTIIIATIRESEIVIILVKVAVFAFAIKEANTINSTNIVKEKQIVL